MTTMLNVNVLAQMLGEQQGEEAAQVGLNTVLGVFVPLLQQFILEGKAAEDSGHDIKQVCTSWLGLWWLLAHLFLCC